MMAKVLLLIILAFGASYPVATTVIAQSQVSSASVQALVVSLRAGIGAALTVPGQPSLYYSNLHAASGHLLLAQEDLADGNTSGTNMEIQLAMALTGTITEQNVTSVAESSNVEAALVSNYTSRLSYMIQRINDSAVHEAASGRLEAIMNSTSIIAHSNNAGAPGYLAIYGQLNQLNAYIVQNYSLPQFSNEFQVYYSMHYQREINSNIDYARSHGNEGIYDRLITFNSTINSIVESLNSAGSVSGYIHDYDQYYRQVENLTQIGSMQGNLGPGRGSSPPGAA